MIWDRMLTLQELDTAEPNSTLRSWVFTYFYNWPDEPIDCFYTAVRWKVHDWSLYASKIPDWEFMPEISKMDCANEKNDFILL